MAENNKLYVGDAPAALIVNTGSNITTATKVTIEVVKPDSPAVVEWVGAVYEDTKIIYYTAALDLIEGLYRVQAVVTTALGTLRGDTVLFRVYNEFD